MLGPQFPTDTAALIQTIVVASALVAAHSDQDRAAFQAGRAARGTYAARLRLALGLASESAVEMPLADGRSDPEIISGLSSEVLSQRPTMT